MTRSDAILVAALAALLASPASAQRTAAPRDAPGQPSWRCGEKTYCTQMSSCAEAMFHFRQCGLTRLDGDRDGIPCERLCGGSGSGRRR